MSELSSSRRASFILLTLIYFVGAGVGFLAYRFLTPCISDHYWLIFWADVIATVVVWAFGLAYRNVSVYDPYWSVAPPIVLTAVAIQSGNLSCAGIALLIAVWYWGIRLTGNWAYTFRNLNTEDWRYTKYRTEQKPFIFQIINFFGLNMMPTIVVFLAMLPGIDLLYNPGSASWLTWLGFAISVGAATLQLVADTQRHRFAQTAQRGEVCTAGLWKHGRHPNYLGEIMMWWGVWLMFVSVNGLERNLWYLAGPVAMTLLFLFISIPLMEKRQLQNKPGYAEYKKRTRIFI